jgi:hypothetical protein
MTFYALLLLTHSWNRWLVVLTLLYTTVRAWYGFLGKRDYTKSDTMMRGITVGVNHLQIIVGFVLYFISPLMEYFRSDMREAVSIPEVAFFGIVHISLMLIAAVMLTIGGAISRRAATDAEKFRTTAMYFTVAVVLIALAIPSPISPFAMRPWVRLDF